MGIGERLAEERKRKGLSQAAFAELIGVSFSSQRRYENGSRDADTGYLDSLRKHGVDVEYVLSGRSKDSGAFGVDEFDLAHFGLAVAKLKQILPQEILGVRKAAEDSMADLGSLPPDESVIAYEEAFLMAVADLFRRKEATQCISSPVEKDRIDAMMLAAVLEAVDSLLQANGLPIVLAKKAQAVAMLYRSFKASGKVDPDMIEEAVKLAAG